VNLFSSRSNEVAFRACVSRKKHSTFSEVPPQGTNYVTERILSLHLHYHQVIQRGATVHMRMHEAVNESKRRLRSAVILQAFDMVPTREVLLKQALTLGTDAAENSHCSRLTASCSGKIAAM
jgi:hypothetical protein